MRIFRYKSTIFATLLIVAVTVAACGRGRVDESLLPTAVPTLGVETLNPPVQEAPASAATATEAPAVVHTDTPTQEPTATEAVVASEAQPESPLAQPEVAATSEPTVTASLEASESVTPTEVVEIEPTVEATITPTLAITTTDEMTSSEPITAVEAITTEETITKAATITTTQAETESITTTSDAMQNELPAGVAEALKNADPANGQLLTQKNACIGCHSLDEGVKLVGPSWYGLADRAGERVPGQSAEVYLYHSIANPNEHLVEGYAAGLMLQTYRDTLSDQDFADIIAFLMTLKTK